MARCDVCGNDYARPMVIRVEERMGTFDSFECAIHAMAPTCAHCGCRVVGHGVESGVSIYCCASCARHADVATASA
jgi:hypothetical protein